MRKTLQYIEKAEAIHFSFDIDALDPTLAPSTGFPVADGLSLEDSCYIARALRNTNKLGSLDVVEINPLIQPEEVEKTLASATAIISSALGLHSVL